MTSSSKFELICIVLLGLGHMFVFIGNDAQTFLVESVTHSVNARQPDRIGAHAGYYGQAVCFVAFMFGCLFTPSILPVLSAKWTLFFGSLCFTIYHTSFFYLNSYLYYFCCTLVGTGFARTFPLFTDTYFRDAIDILIILILSLLYWLWFIYDCTFDEKNYRTELGYNVVYRELLVIITVADLFFSAALLVIILHFNDSANSSADISNSTMHSAQPASSREFTDSDIALMYGAFAAVTVCSNIIFALIPARDIDDCIEGGKPKRLLSFTEEMMGVIITYGSRLVKDFGLSPTMSLSSATTIVALGTIAASVPQWATITPTNEPAWLIQPSIWLTLLVGFTFGMIDSATNTVRNVACALAMPEARAQAFAISKFYQAFASALSMVLSSRMSIYHHVELLILTTIISTLALVWVQRRINSKTSSTLASPSSIKLRNTNISEAN
ncbi:hypothetical protein NECAME_12219 [Necator americanus]|uniref:Uncharacterized protein n=1 Tax=Necator americanus TaxID=51031 RepID=W2T330_NECAM|nr:hypothetical protein NECAME_12219 [Necator americanus]ETN75646.1 hypothetical protein NECAME_12219 [Necator americanus]